jgi:hypothetical protein
MNDKAPGVVLTAADSGEQGTESLLQVAFSVVAHVGRERADAVSEAGHRT